MSSKALYANTNRVRTTNPRNIGLSVSPVMKCAYTKMCDIQRMARTHEQ